MQSYLIMFQINWPSPSKTRSIFKELSGREIVDSYCSKLITPSFRILVCTIYWFRFQVGCANSSSTISQVSYFWTKNQGNCEFMLSTNQYQVASHVRVAYYPSTARRRVSL